MRKLFALAAFAAGISCAWPLAAADVRISDLPATTTITDADILAIVDMSQVSGQRTRKITVSDLGNYLATKFPAGPQGPTGSTGSTGPAGPANTLSIGTVSSGTAAATITGTAPSQVLNLTYPLDSFSIGTVTTGSAGGSASASITGTPPSQVLNLTIPTGATGSQGPAGTGNVSTSGTITDQGVVIFSGTGGNVTTGVPSSVRTTLGLGTAATAASSSFLQTANNLSDVVAATARTNLGLGSLATLSSVNNSNWSGTALAPGNGGTGLTSYTIGDLLTATGSGTLASLADAATGNVLISGGAGVAPSYGKVGLTTAVSGTLPVTNGGTGSGTAGGTALDNVSALSTTGFVNRTGAGAYSTVSATNGITAAMMAQAPALTLRGNITGATANVADNSPPAVLDAAFGSTQGNVLYRGSSAWVVLAPGSSGNVLQSGGAAANPSWLAAAAASDVRTGTDATKPVTSAALAGSQAFQTLTDAATVAWNGASGYNATVTLAGNRTLGAITNPVVGQTYTLLIVQDATGSRTLAYNAAYDFGAAGTPTLTTTASKTDMLTLICTNAATPTFNAFLNKGF